MYLHGYPLNTHGLQTDNILLDQNLLEEAVEIGKDNYPQDDTTQHDHHFLLQKESR